MIKGDYDKFIDAVVGESVNGQRGAKEIFELVLNSGQIDAKAELAGIGAKVGRQMMTVKPRYKAVIIKRPNPEADYHRIISKIREPVPRAKLIGLGYDAPEKKEDWAQSKEFSQEFYDWADNLKSNVLATRSNSHSYEVQPRMKYTVPIVKRLGIAVIILGGVSAVAYFGFGRSGFNIKNDVMEESNAGVKNLESAGKELKQFNFKNASGNFKEAYDNFSKAGETLNFMGANLSELIAGLPGAGKLRSAKNLIEVGRLLADTGNKLSEAVSAVSKTGIILNPLAESADGKGNLEIINLIENASFAAKDNLRKAKFLLADIDESIIPEDKVKGFEDFKSKIPLFEKLVDDAVDYSGFLSGLVGAEKPKRYLILFQNTSELRPTGGFPGTYAVVTFESGKLKDFFVDDIYNIDGQLKRTIIPPKPLQHITPTWGMRDANWFADFPTSARKIEWFLKEEGGYDVDGVITVSPKIISKFLDTIGPVAIPGYGLNVNGDNFLTAIQSEVEYGKNRTQPKQVVMDMAPKLLEGIYSAQPGKWLEIFNAIVSGLEERDILMYFNDLYLENFAVERGFGGELKNVDGDYLMVNVSNVKGSKTDAVVDNSLKLSTTFDNSGISHKLAITRKHNGGSSRYGFYNKDSPAYIRVLVPKNSQLTGITGNDNPGFKPLLNYNNYRFEKDDQLVQFESSADTGPGGASTYIEGQMTEFGFWLITKPGEERTVELEYKVPLRLGSGYKMYIQKQPGLTVNDLGVSFYSMNGREIGSSNLQLDRVGNVYTIESRLDGDLPIELRFK